MFIKKKKYIKLIYQNLLLFLLRGFAMPCCQYYQNTSRLRILLNEYIIQTFISVYRVLRSLFRDRLPFVMLGTADDLRRALRFNFFKHTG